MYQTYLWKIKPISSYMTPWQSDTIYGHLLWAAKLFFGEEEIEKTINEFEDGKAPFIVSDGFTSSIEKTREDKLEDNKELEKVAAKLPILKKTFSKREKTQELSKKYNKDTISIVKKLKEINKIKEVDIDVFNKFRGNYDNDKFIEEQMEKSVVGGKNKKYSSISSPVMHNNINRLSGTTEDNDLYSLRENFAGEICIYVKLKEDYPVEKFEKLLSFIEMNGFGKKSSSGKGAIERISFDKFDGFTKIDNANGFVVLSNYIPKEKDYKKIISGNTVLKIGKVANIDGNEDFPFKKPFTCFGAGSLFLNGENQFVGKVLKDIHIDKKIVQIGIPFTLEVLIDEK